MENVTKYRIDSRFPAIAAGSGMFAEEFFLRILDKQLLFPYSVDKHNIADFSDGE